jgi:zinc transport system substrate-binding protein
MFKLIYLLCLVLNFGCQKTPVDISKVEPLVIVSISPYEAMVKDIVGDTISVKTVIPSGANVHSYEPKPSSLKDFEKAAIYFKLGESIEQKLSKILQQKNENLIVYDLKTNIQLLDDCCLGHQHEMGKDIHLWLSPKLMTRQVIAMGKILINRFPENAKLYQENLNKLIYKLENINVEISKKISQLKTKVILASHPAFAYFCKDFNCRQIALEYEGKDPLPKQLNEIIWDAASSGVKAIIVLPQFSIKSATYVSKELDLPIYEFDPYSLNYFMNMKYLTNLIIISNESSN